MNILSSILPWVQIFLSFALIALILLQQNEASLGASFGGDDGSGIFRKKRGLEKTIFQTTIVIAILFVLAAILNLII